jgi:hypothetical protein
VLDGFEKRFLYQFLGKVKISHHPHQRRRQATCLLAEDPGNCGVGCGLDRSQP